MAWNTDETKCRLKQAATDEFAANGLHGTRMEAIAKRAGRVYDYDASHPQLTRLLHWEALAYGEGEIPDEEARMAYYRHKAAAFAEANARASSPTRSTPTTCCS
jgi:hypothetical protein